MMASDYKYRAFISYSWADAQWGKWLQHAVETYRTPGKLIEKHADTREIPARLTPLFKDREEQAAGASIGASIQAALADSEFLIVICSPNSAQSQWVNHEIAWFKTNRNPDKILALIVAGEPGDEAQECFPKALTHKIAPDLTIMDELDDAPLAADAREGGDGKRLAKMKLVAAMLGVGLDQLLRRDDRRRVVRARIVAAASLALALVMSGLTWFAVEQRNEADRQRAEADGLIEFMLTDLRDKLEPVGRLDVLDVVGQRALTYYAGQNPGSLDADALGRRARALLLVGEITNIRGNSEEALKAFTEAAATTQEQLARDPNNEQRIFDHAQSVFWVGYIAYNRGELENAEAQFREYKRLADRLIELNPDKPEWQMESSYAETNLGVMFVEQGRFAEARPAFERGLKQIEAVARIAPYDAGLQVEIGTNINWLAIVNEELGKEKEALALHLREVATYEDVLKRDPANASAKYKLALAHQFVGAQQFRLGQIGDAIQSYERGLSLNGEMRQLEPANTDWQHAEVTGRLDLADNFAYAGRTNESRIMLEAASSLLSQMIAKDPKNAAWTGALHGRELRTRVRLALESGDTARAQSLVLQTLGLELEGKDRTAVLLLAGDVEAKRNQPEKARAHWNAALALLSDAGGADLERFRLLKRLGQTDQAAEIREKLDRRGFRHPAYLMER